MHKILVVLFSVDRTEFTLDPAFKSVQRCACLGLQLPGAQHLVETSGIRAPTAVQNCATKALPTCQESSYTQRVPL